MCVPGNIKHTKSNVSNCSFASEMEVDLIQLLSTGREPVALVVFSCYVKGSFARFQNSGALT